jgi:hypothetical protein
LKDEGRKMDPILAWNGVALEANRVSHTNGKNEQTGPTLSSRALAIVHLAMYDAYAGFVNDANKLPPYIGGIPFPAGASVNAAVAAAAHQTLSELFPSQKAFFDLVLEGAGDESDPGHAFGVAVAQQILADRAGDPDAGAGGYKPSPQRGKHRPDPDNPDQGFHAPFYGAKSKLFAATARYELDPPPQPGQPDYTTALEQVRRRGIAPELMGTLPEDSPRRTTGQTLIGVYWGYDGASGLGTPPRLYNQIVRKVANNKNNSAEDNARLFALVNTAMADAGILSWDQKYIHNLWRPVVGIREHEESMGPEGVGGDPHDPECQVDWLPLGAPLTNKVGKNFTPPFPAYPSGHATFGAAALHITRLFYGRPLGNTGPDNLFQGLTFVSDEHNGTNKDNKGAVRPRNVRSFTDGLRQMIVQNGRSRVWLGVHWMFDAFAVDNNGEPDFTQNVGGVPLGIKIAEDIFDKGTNKKTVNKSNVPPRP